MTKEICRHFYGKIPFEDYLELREGDEKPCICDKQKEKRKSIFSLLKIDSDFKPCKLAN